MILCPYKIAINLLHTFVYAGHNLSFVMSVIMRFNWVKLARIHPTRFVFSHFVYVYVCICLCVFSSIVFPYREWAVRVNSRSNQHQCQYKTWRIDWIARWKKSEDAIVGAFARCNCNDNKNIILAAATEANVWYWVDFIYLSLLHLSVFISFCARYMIILALFHNIAPFHSSVISVVEWPILLQIEPRMASDSSEPEVHRSAINPKCIKTAGQ